LQKSKLCIPLPPANELAEAFFEARKSPKFIKNKVWNFKKSFYLCTPNRKKGKKKKASSNCRLKIESK
jgi:hypothetical protein